MPQARRGTVLFFTHSGDRVGPPMILLDLLTWIAANTDLRFEVLLWRGGPLEAEFGALAPVHDVDRIRRWPLAARLEALGRPGRRAAALLREARLRLWLWRNPRLRTVVVVSVGPNDYLRHLRPRRPRVVTMALELGLQLVHLDDNDGRLRRETERFVAGMPVIRDALVGLGIDPGRIALAREFVDTRPPAPVRVVERSELGIPEDGIVVGSAGVMEWRKAPELFVQIARAACAAAPELPLHFVWIGGDDQGYAARLADEVDRAGLSGRVHFPGRQSNPWDWFAMFDLFLLTSREDAFPLVCLENASVGNPVLCFDTGGMPEFVGDDECGAVVAFPDVELMAERVVALAADGDERRRRGELGRERVRERYDVSVCAPLWYEAMEPLFP
ncbi:MAG: glycosyltransferase [Acidimicrobiales bacterium]|nr:glycosyltransferase [Acidimicrobiales bacterium]